MFKNPHAMTINARNVILFCFTMLFQLLLLNKVELDDRELWEVVWPSVQWDSEMCLERWRKITDVCDVIVRPPPVRLLTSVFLEKPENINSMYVFFSYQL
jgi:hypothetical protein